MSNITFIFCDMALGDGDKNNIINLGEMGQVWGVRTRGMVDILHRNWRCFVIVRPCPTQDE